MEKTITNIEYKGTCAVCEFHRSAKCFLKPPIANLVMQQGLGGQVQPAVISYRPEVSDNDFCSEFVSFKGEENDW